MQLLKGESLSYIRSSPYLLATREHRSYYAETASLKDNFAAPQNPKMPSLLYYFGELRESVRGYLSNHVEPCLRIETRTRAHTQSPSPNCQYNRIVHISRRGAPCVAGCPFAPSLPPSFTARLMPFFVQLLRRTPRSSPSVSQSSLFHIEVGERALNRPSLLTPFQSGSPPRLF